MLLSRVILVAHNSSNNTRSLLAKSNSATIRHGLKTLSSKHKREISKNQLAGAKKQAISKQGVRVKAAVAGGSVGNDATDVLGSGTTVPAASPAVSSDNTPLIIGGGILVAGGAASVYYWKSMQKEEETTKPTSSTYTSTPNKTDLGKQQQEEKPVDMKEKEENTTVETEANPDPNPKKGNPDPNPKKGNPGPNPKKGNHNDGNTNPNVGNNGVTVEAMIALGVKGRSSTTEEAPPTLPLPEHEASGNRVVSLSSTQPSPSTQQAKEASKNNNELLEAATELQSTTLNQSHASVQKALSLLRADVDQSYLSDMDTLTLSQLKIRLVQLSSELTDRARYEALRTKEILALQDKEITHKYLDLLQQQRLEFEDIVARRIREQEDELSRKTNTLLQEKDASIQALLKASTEALEQEHQLTLTSNVQQLKLQLEQQFQIQYEDKLSQTKELFKRKLANTTDSMEELQETSSKLQKERHLNQTFQLDSVKAHSICAAALTLMNKLSSSKENVSVLVEVQVLQTLIDKDGVLASALSALPKSVLNKGVPSLSELQVRFDHVHATTRQAAMVPEGKYDLFSQLFGILFATLTIPPSPSFPNEINSPADALSIDYRLSNAHHYIQLGQLEEALEQLNQIKATNQASFSIRDWKQDAEDRVAIEKVRKIIQLECAILNATMSGTSSTK